jgi:hypothetical protein
MTIPSQYPIPPVVPIVPADDDEQNDSDATRDSDGVPVGRADADEDARRTGADPDES